MNPTPDIVVVARSTSLAEQLARRVERAGFAVVARRDAAAVTAEDGSGGRLVVVDGTGATVDDVIRRLHGARLIVVGGSTAFLSRIGSAAAGAVADDADDVVLAAAIRAVSAGLRVTPPIPAHPSTVDAESPAGDLAEAGYEEALTEREREVLDLVATGMSNHAIAARLGISSHTVKFHLASVFGKLDVSTRTAAVRRGLARGLITI